MSIPDLVDQIGEWIVVLILTVAVVWMFLKD